MQLYTREVCLTLAEADTLALAGGHIRSRGYGYELNPSDDALTGGAEAEYSLCTVGTRGTGNCGSTYLRGKTPRARRLVKAGKITRLQQAGISHAIARVAVSMPYGMETGVSALAETLVDQFRHMPALAKSLAEARSHARFRRLTGIDSDLSMPRKLAAVAIATAASR